ncbi:MAG: hypothetical protein ACFCUM_09835 [Bacteroidales bacterium]
MDKEIKILWKSLEEFEMVTFDKETLSLKVQSHCSKIEKQIKRRNTFEIMTAISMMPAAVLIAWLHQSILVKSGALLMLPYLVYVIFKILHVRKWKKPVDEFSDNLEFIRQNLLYYRKEKHLLETVPYWYVTPVVICTTLILIGTGLSGFKLYYAFTVMIGMVYLITSLNKQVVARRISPLIEKLEDEIKNAEATN